jgi:hypothetical protein
MQTEVTCMHETGAWLGSGSLPRCLEVDSHPSLGCVLQRTWKHRVWTRVDILLMLGNPPRRAARKPFVSLHLDAVFVQDLMFGLCCASLLAGSSGQAE